MNYTESDRRRYEIAEAQRKWDAKLRGMLNAINARNQMLYNKRKKFKK